MTMPLNDITPDYAADSVASQQVYDDHYHHDDDSSDSSRACKRFSKWYRVAGLIIVIFFLVYMISLFAIYYQEYNETKSSSSTTLVSVPVSVPVCHFILCAVAVIFGIFLIFTNKPLHRTFAMVAGLLFLIFWVVNSVVASQTSVYKAAQNNMSPSSYQELTTQIRSSVPQVSIRVSGSYDDYYYYTDDEGRTHYEKRVIQYSTPYVTFDATSSTDNSRFPNINNTNDELIYVQLDKDIQWTKAALDNIQSLKSQFLSAMKYKYDLYNWKVSDSITLPNYIESTVVSDTKLEGVLSSTSRYLLSIFWAPAAYIYKLAASTLYMRGKVIKLNCYVSSGPYDFSKYPMN
ncbi:hypothetical protein GPJ56_006255 [Histomonas meleagridis]|nr:hypothetical protein GPJ56_006255 [Histomonas meleagridis]